MRHNCINRPNNDECPILPGPFPIIIGQTGPAGESEGLSAYGGRYNNSGSVINLTIGSAAVVPLTENMPSKDVTYGTNNITVSEAGVYEIN